VKKRKTAFMEWIDGQLEATPRLEREVDELVNEMKLEQDLAALRERRGLSQRQLAKLLGTSQPYVAKLESGRIKNFGVNTLVKYARALGGSVTIKIEPSRHAVARRSGRLRKAG
jgi:predicted XRE-type DNA-binding protein